MVVSREDELVTDICGEASEYFILQESSLRKMGSGVSATCQARNERFSPPRPTLMTPGHGCSSASRREDVR